VQPEALEEIDAWLAPYRRMWTESLAALDAHLAAIDEGRRG
jgi:hypothetical protein